MHSSMTKILRIHSQIQDKIIHVKWNYTLLNRNMIHIRKLKYTLFVVGTNISNNWTNKLQLAGR
jgi:hypothetical protein